MTEASNTTSTTEVLKTLHGITSKVKDTHQLRKLLKYAARNLELPLDAFLARFNRIELEQSHSAKMAEHHAQIAEAERRYKQELGLIDGDATASPDGVSAGGGAGKAKKK